MRALEQTASTTAHAPARRFGALLLPDEPDCLAEGFVPEFQDEKSSRGWGAGTLTSSTGQRQLRLWGLTLGMTL